MIRRPLILTALASAALLTLPGVASAAPNVINASPEMIADSGDTAWVLACALLTLLAGVPGVVLTIAGGFGRTSLARIVPAVTAALALATLLFVLIGYAIAFGIDGNAWIGSISQAMLNAMGTVRDGTTIAETAFVLSQGASALLAVTLLASWLAPRAGRGWLLAFSGLWTLIVLMPIMRWVWGGGWLMAMNGYDRAGGLVVFYAAAVSAVIALFFIGKPDNEEEPEATDPLLRIVGAGLLLVGMMAQASGSTLGSGDDAAVATLTMLLAAMTGALTAAALNRNLNSGTLAGGMVCGIVGIAAAADTVSMGSAWIIGVLVTLAAHFGPRLMPQKLRLIDVSGTALPIAAAAKTGALLLGIFLAFYPFGGAGYLEGMSMGGQLFAQLVTIIVTALWAVIGTTIVALSVGLVLPMKAQD